MAERKYEPMSDFEYALSISAVETALVKHGFAPPTLYAGKSLIIFASRIAEASRINAALDSDLNDTEWYIEWNGKRIGSLGC